MPSVAELDSLGIMSPILVALFGKLWNLYTVTYLASRAGSLMIGLESDILSGAILIFLLPDYPRHEGPQ